MGNDMKQVLLILGPLLFLNSNCYADCAGKVLAVLEGDAIVIDCAGMIEVGLYGIDAPEIAQPAGREAQFFVSSITLNKTVNLVEKKRDEQGRISGIVILPDGKNLNREIVRAGYAWYHEAASKDKVLSDLEKGAREKKIGLWVDPAPEAPRDFRSRNLTSKYSASQSTAAAQPAGAQLSSSTADADEIISPTRIPKLPRRDDIGVSFRYKQYRLNNVELEEHKNLASLNTFSRDQLSRLIFLDRKVSIARGGGGGTVYITRGGDEYHKISCPELGKLPDNYVRTVYGWVKMANDYSFPVPLDRARLAFFPCPICDPPQ